MLTHKTDIYNCITVLTSENTDVTCDNLEVTLQECLSQWKSDGFRAVQIEIDISQSDWIPICAKLGFDFHHARGKQAMMMKWIEEGTTSSIPLYPYTSVGVGGVVMSDDEQILLMKELRGAWKGWKFPGGFAEPGEDLFDTACREVLEETGVECDADALLAFRHMHKFKFPECSDFYFLCLLKPKDGKAATPTPCPRETADCRWFKIEDLEALDITEFSQMSRWVLERYTSYKAGNIQGIKPNDIQSHGRTYKVYNIPTS